MFPLRIISLHLPTVVHEHEQIGGAETRDAGDFGSAVRSGQTSHERQCEEELFHSLGLFFKVSVWPAMGVSIIG